jgi:hypothetical protein
MTEIFPTIDLDTCAVLETRRVRDLEVTRHGLGMLPGEAVMIFSAPTKRKAAAKQVPEYRSNIATSFNKQMLLLDITSTKLR